MERALTGEPAGVEPDLMLTRELSRRLDHLACERYGLSTLVLMENAARCVCDLALHMLETGAHHPTTARVTLVCGPGNNGGDGLAAARHLSNAGLQVRIIMIGEVHTISPDCATNLRIARAMGLHVEHWGEGTALGSSDLVIDAIFGTGLSRPLDAPCSSLVRLINASGVRTLAVDVPSGLDADTGRALGGQDAAVVRAESTLALCALKPGLIADCAHSLVGDLYVGDIGVPRALLHELGVPRCNGSRTGTGAEGSGHRIPDPSPERGADCGWRSM